MTSTQNDRKALNYVGLMAINMSEGHGEGSAEDADELTMITKS